MKEFNKHNLIEAIQSLPEYEPKDSLWDKISDELEANPVDVPLQKCISELPQYEPPAFIWDNIEKGLQPQKTAKIVRFRRSSYAAAAAMAVLLAAFGWLMLGDNSESIDLGSGDLAYSTETVDDKLLAHDWNEDEDGFELVMNICNEQKFKCDNPEFKALKAELEELNEAKEELEYAIGSYGTNADLIAQIREIEFARTDLLEKIIHKVI